ncbi:MAG: hypothetical protein U5P10_17265 [Spirochaetia bacterium]|nr:hypothetical protein [Spirochaetia bacterium]
MEALSFIVSMGTYTLFLFLFLEYTREKESFYKWFFILALLTFPLWFLNLEGFFRWSKTLSVLIPLCFVSYIRMANNGRHQNRYPALKKQWPLWILFGVLALNILEATITDFQMGNPFNALCGVILIITIPLPSTHWRIAKYDGHRHFGELIADLPIAWCLLYTVWNAAFVYGENPSYFASSICILTVPLLWMLIKKRSDLWLMGRIYTLGIHILIRSSYDIFTPVMDSSAWFNPQVHTAWGMLNLGLHIFYVGYWFMKYRNKDYVMKYSARAYGN